jgi:hypothetical protein
MPRSSLVTRIQTEPAYRAVIRLVGYLGIAYPISREDTNRLYGEFGKETVQAATDQLIDYDTEAKVARLKPGIRRLCKPLLGPSPEEWDEFYEGIENPPPNPYKQEMDAVAEAVADAFKAETGHDCVVTPAKDNPEKRILAIRPSGENAQRPFAEQTDKRLLELLDCTQYELTKAKPSSVSFREALRDIGLIAAELQRRDRTDPSSTADLSHRQR